MKTIKKSIIFFILFFSSSVCSSEETFSDWLKSFKKIALKNNISEKTFNAAMLDVKYLPKVIEYDRFQPEFYEYTITYISKRSSKKKIKTGPPDYCRTLFNALGSGLKLIILTTTRIGPEISTSGS